MSASRREDRTRLEGFELEIFQLVSKGATSEQWREWLRVPLEHAAAAGNMDLFTRLMDAGANGSAGWRGCHGRTLLGAAAEGEHDEKMMLTLLRAGAKNDVDVQFGAKRHSALHVAAARGAEGASRALMFAGADPNLVDRANRSPLYIAADAGHDVVVSDLLVKGANPNAKDRSKTTPLHAAAYRGWLSCVSKLLLGGAEKNPRNTHGQTPLHLAACNNQPGAVEELLAAEAGLDIRTTKGCRPLDIAAARGHLDVLGALVRHGSDVKACDDNGFTALHYTATIEDPDIDRTGAIRWLIEAGADLEAKTTDDSHGTPLHAAVCHGISPTGVMVALLEGGSNATARCAGGLTPLHHACRCSNVGAVELLLRWGADEALVDENGDTAAEKVGAWVGEDEEGSGSDEEASRLQRKAYDQRIRRMLARAPADRSWRRRGWLVLSRARPDRVQLANDSRSSNGGSSATVAEIGCSDRGGGGDGGGDGEQAMCDFGKLARRVVGVDADCVFRMVIGFL